jgi:uncharacterized membrane protein
MKHQKALLLPALLFLFAVAPAEATDFTICNKGTVTGWAVTATRNGSGVFTVVHTWKVSGWYEIAPKRCETVFRDGEGEPIYVGLAFTDFMGRWGAFSSADEQDDQVFHNTRLKLCVVRDRAFDYTRGGSDPGGPCKDGYYPFPATLYVTPTSTRGENTFSFEINGNSLVVPVDVPAPAGGTSGGPSGAPSGGSAGKTAAVVGGLGAALIIGKLIADELNSSGDASGAPSPFEAGTLNAMLLGKRIVRRSSGRAWYYEDGSRVNPVYRLEGQAQSDLLDAPVQREVSDADVAAAQASLNRALSGFSRNRRTEVLNTGRLFYSFEDEGGLLHQALTNLSTLEFAQARRLADVGGIAGFEIPCRDEHPCTIGLDKDKAGHLSNNHIYSSVILYFANDEDADGVWRALLRLRDLYPAGPAVVAR